MSESRHLSTHIARPAAEVYAFVTDPARLPEWAAGLGGSVEERDGRWFAESPMGEVEVRFAPENPFGVADHDVTLPDGQTFSNPMRVLPDGDGCEVVFTLRRQPEMTDDAFEADTTAIRTDLATLQRLLER
jgi:polyketide cyclase/dehydrase/lipid transport protein